MSEYLSPRKIAEDLGLLIRPGATEIQSAVNDAIDECPGAVSDYRAGNGRALNFIVGCVMKKTHGKADARHVGEIVRKSLTT